MREPGPKRQQGWLVSASYVTANSVKAILGVFWVLSLVLFFMCLSFQNKGTTLNIYRLDSGLHNETKCI